MVAWWSCRRRRRDNEPPADIFVTKKKNILKDNVPKKSLNNEKNENLFSDTNRSPFKIRTTRTSNELLSQPVSEKSNNEEPCKVFLSGSSFKHAKPSCPL